MMMTMRKYILAALTALLLLSVSAQAQNGRFRIGKWVEIHNAIMTELNRSYVDTLPLSRMETAAAHAMLEVLDPYTVYIPEEEREDMDMVLNKVYGGIGALIYKPDQDGNVIINEPYENSPAALAGLRCGDEIVTIDGVSTHGLTSAEASERMRGEPGTSVVFRVKRIHDGVSWKAGDLMDIKIVRKRIHLPDVEYAGLLDDGETGYLLLTGYTEGAADAVKASFLQLKQQGMKKFVLDLRGNGGGRLNEAVDIVSLFVPRGSIVVTSKGRTSDTDYEYKTTKAPCDLEMPVVVLVDGGSASASEIVSGALQDYDRATIIGTRTYGKGLVQSIRPLPYDGQLKVTTAKYYTPSGRCVQAIDYAKRGEDGSVSPIPDSLTHAFTTAHGRTVRDGGGITPDHIVKAKKYSRLAYALVLGGIVDNYALKYAQEHASIPALKDFHYTDYEDFVAFAKEKEFDYRSNAMAIFDQLKAELKEDGLEEVSSEQVAALGAVLEMDKETFLRLQKDEIIPFIEEEIAVRYYYQRGGILINMRYDTQLQQALTLPLISF